jgi:hypothetical protein
VAPEQGDEQGDEACGHVGGSFERVLRRDSLDG